MVKKAQHLAGFDLTTSKSVGRRSNHWAMNKFFLSQGILDGSCLQIVKRMVWGGGQMVPVWLLTEKSWVRYLQSFFTITRHSNLLGVSAHRKWVEWRKNGLVCLSCLRRKQIYISLVWAQRIIRIDLSLLCHRMVKLPVRSPTWALMINLYSFQASSNLFITLVIFSFHSQTCLMCGSTIL